MVARTKSDSIKFLLLGYVVLIALFTMLLVMDTSMLHEQFDVLESSDLQTQKMRTIVELIEVARKRVHLSHEMISTDDVFKKDEISQSISQLAVEFIVHHDRLAKSLANEQEREKLKQQSTYYPMVVERLRQVMELALEDGDDNKLKARDIIIHEVVPLQEMIVDGFMQLLSDIQMNMDNSRKTAVNDYLKNKKYRMALVIFIFIGSISVLLWVIRRMLFIEQKLHSISLTDALTGIANRRRFDEELKLEWQRAQREQQYLSVLLVDVDYFKNYNDYYGHQQGDQCLIQVASIINKASNRANDLAARYGGEEFSMILPATDVNGAKQIAEQLLQQVRDSKIEHKASDISGIVTVSIGIAIIKPSMKDKWDKLIEQADHALYTSKKLGRNQSIIFSENIN